MAQPLSVPFATYSFGPSHPTAVWLHASVLPIMDAYFDAMSSWCSSIAFTLAVAWIIYRIAQILRKPNEELIKLLGIEIPLPPVLALSSLKADGFVLRWRPGDEKYAASMSLKHRLYVNGVCLGEIKPQDSSVIVSGLEPDKIYAVRMFAASTSNFVAGSEPVYAQTLSKESGEYFSHEEPQGATVAPYKPPTESTSAPPTPVSREHSSSISHRQKAMMRRTTQTQIDDDETGESVTELTERLERLRVENRTMNEAIQAEQAEFEAKQAAMTKELQNIQQQVFDKSSVSKELQKQISLLVAEESQARKRKLTTEARLEKALAEREKMKADIKRWEADAPIIEAKIEQMAKEQEEYAQEAQKKAAALRSDIAKELEINRQKEEKLRQTVVEIKKIESEIRELEADDQDTDYMTEDEFQAQAMANRDTILQLSYQINELRAASAEMQQRHDYVTSLLNIQPDLASPRRNSTRRRAPSLGSARGTGASSYEHHRPFDTDSATTMPFISQPVIDAQMSQEDIDMLTAGAMASPTVADGLLPTGLFIDEGDPNLHVSTDSPRLPGLGIKDMYEPSSPASIPSRSPSAFTSPQQSTTNLGIIDSDRRSIRSATGSTRQGSGSKFASIFHIRRGNRQSIDETPTLGSLRPSSTASFPRDSEKGSHSGMSGLIDNFNIFGRSNTTDLTETSSSRGWGFSSGSSRQAEQSADHMLPRNLGDLSNVPWSNQPPSRGGPSIGMDWALAPPSAGWASSHSRNPSSFGAANENVLDDAPSTTQQLPIGTRPVSAHVSNPSTGSVAKLNPNAPTFKAFFNKSDKQKAEKSSKKKDKSPRQAQPNNLDSSLLGTVEDQSPSQHRLSRDAMSLSTVDYSSDANRDDSLDLPPGSVSTTDADSSQQTPGQSQRESLMKKISRKSSAGFTTLAGRKNKKKGGGAAQTPKLESTPSAGETGLTAGDDILSQSINSTLSTDDKGIASPSSARFSFRRRGKKKADKTEKSAGEADVEESNVSATEGAD